MLRWALVLFALALAASVVAFASTSPELAGIAKLVAAVLVATAAILVLRDSRPPRPRPPPERRAGRTP